MVRHLPIRVHPVLGDNHLISAVPCGHPLQLEWVRLPKNDIWGSASCLFEHRQQTSRVGDEPVLGGTHDIAVRRAKRQAGFCWSSSDRRGTHQERRATSKNGNEGHGKGRALFSGRASASVFGHLDSAAQVSTFGQTGAFIASSAAFSGGAHEEDMLEQNCPTFLGVIGSSCRRGSFFPQKHP